MMMGSLIMALGAQNTWVLKQGLLRQHVFLVAITCWACDAMLSAIGIWGLASITDKLPQLTFWLSLAGGLLLLAYAALAGYRALRGTSHISLTMHDKANTSWQQVGALTLALSLLNPHVYVDNVLLVGSVAAHWPSSAQASFWLGVCCVSALWFFGLAYGARLLLPLFRRERTWQWLDGLIAWMMLYLGLKLLLPLL